MRLLVCWCSLATLLVGGQAFAGVADTVTVLPPVIVTGQRDSTDDRTTATRQHLDRSQIARFLPATSADALLTVPGVDLVRTGPWASRVAVRGLSGERVLVMLDGVPLDSGRGHGAQLSLVSADRLDAIEVLPGAGSSQFGSSALGGAVQLISHRDLISHRPAATFTLISHAATPGGELGQTARLRVTTREIGAELSGSLGRLGHLDTPEGRLFNSGYHDQDFAGRVAAKLGDWALDLEHTRHAAYDIGLPAFNQTSGSTAEYPLQSRDADRFEVVHAALDRVPELRLLAVQQRFGTDFVESTVDSEFVRGRFVATRTTAASDRIVTWSRGVQPSVKFTGPGNLQLHGEYRRETTQGPRTTDETVVTAAGSTASSERTEGESVPHARRDVASGGAFAGARLAGFRVELGARYDWLRSHADSTAQSFTQQLDVTDRRVSTEAGLSRRFGILEPYAHVATGFRAPSLEERYFNDDIHGGLRLFGNPDLRSERSRTFELGLRASETLAGRLTSARVSVYRSDVDDMISLRYLGQLYLVPRFQYQNIRRARLEGVEAALEMRFGNATLALNAATPRGRDLETGDALADIGAPRATLEARTPIGRLLPQGTAALRVVWTGNSPDAQTSLSRPAVTTAAAEVACTALGTRVTFAVRNLTNAGYREPMSFIPEGGRSFALALRRDFSLPIFHNQTER